MGEVKSLGTLTDLEAVIGKPSLSVVHFKSDLFPACQHVRKLLGETSCIPKISDVTIAEINAEDVQSFCMKYQIMQVPTVLYFRNGMLVDRVDSYKPGDITAKINLQARAIDMDAQGPVTVNVSSKSSVPLEERLKSLINREKVMLFMKGSPETPRCGFSKKVVAILDGSKVKYGTFDILEDEEVRQGLKDFSNWQTYPQLYANGELIGGHDIIVELHESAELIPALNGQI